MKVPNMRIIGNDYRKMFSNHIHQRSADFMDPSQDGSKNVQQWSINILDDGFSVSTGFRSPWKLK